MHIANAVRFNDELGKVERLHAIGNVRYSTTAIFPNATTKDLSPAMKTS
jgi:hypothetical protein